MPKHILILNGHPDLCGALADAGHSRWRLRGPRGLRRLRFSAFDLADMQFNANPVMLNKLRWSPIC